MIGTRAIASEARFRIENDGMGEIACVEGFVPVGLGAGVVACELEGRLVGVHEVAVEGEKGTLSDVRTWERGKVQGSEGRTTK